MSKLPSTSPKIPPLSLLLLLLLCLPFLGNSQTENEERTILLNLKQYWENPPSIQLWNSSSSPCDWPEILCIDGSVTGILLSDKDITGKIPPFICDLKNLTKIDLSVNFIPGEFPAVLYNCSKLQFLDLSQNYFVGPIPDDIDRISRLQYLNLGANNFSGDIPVVIGRLAELQTLYLYQNVFNGSFPPEIGNLSNLEVLGLAYNGRFKPARIPSDFGRLKKLKYLWMAESNLIGEIPETLSNLTDLEWLDLSLNDLSGKIPGSLFLLKNLSDLYLHKNRLSGSLPGSIKALNLIGIDISMNNLTGQIPEDFGKLQSLTNLHLFSNRLSGEIPASIGQISSLTTIRLFNNSLTGDLPQELGLHSKLTNFEVSVNRLTGNLPENLCAGGKLRGLIAFSNNFSGELPKTLGNCSSLTTVQVYENRFSGEVPAGLWSSLNLSTLMISDNLFSSKLPGKLAWNLSRLEISNNKFYGEIPAELSGSMNLMVFEASNNLFSGTIPIELTGLPRILTLLLDGNQFSGHLPSMIISWTSLTTLNLSRNQLSGEIPSAIGFLPDLIDLDLSENQLSGQIPPEIGLLRLTYLNLSSNKLTGKIPVQFENLAYDSSFLNNPGLCAVNPILNLGDCYSEPQKSNKSSSPLLVMALVLATAVVLVAVVFALFMIRDYRRRKHGRDIANWKLTSFQRLDFTESNILSSLTENNQIGSGGSGKVYRVAINRGEAVAVKRIWNNRKLEHKLEKEFLAEVQILGTIRHSNIVKLMCYISSENSKLLVYEYMENHSLDQWLHAKKRSLSVSGSVNHAVLDWPRRLQIAVGAAQGLCYMHHDCSPPIIHRDVKSSNILLDSEFKARIADFGLAKVLIKNGEPDTMSTVAGSFGYIAPEYAFATKVNEKIDVYSFGVVLFELATGREAKDGDEQACLVDWAWRHFQEGNSIEDALDQEIKKPCYLNEMSVVFKLGLVCTSTLPSTRPSMKEVLQILLRCSPPLVNGETKALNECDVAPLLSSTNYLSSYNCTQRKRTSDDSLSCNV